MKIIVPILSIFCILPLCAHASEQKNCLLKGDSPTLYAAMPDGTRRVFPNEATWKSWYGQDAGCIQNISVDVLANMPLSGIITLKPGSLIKIPSDPKVYAIEELNILRWVHDEKVAKNIFGDSWNSRIILVDESLLSAYTNGAPIMEKLNYNIALAEAVTRPWEILDADKPVLELLSTSADHLAEIKLTVPQHAKYPTSIVDIGAPEDEQTALALCEIDCSITVQINRPGIFQAMTWFDGMIHVSNKLYLKSE